MNTPRQVLAILGISASVYTSDELIEKKVIRIPKDAPVSDLTPKQYYLFLAYNMLVNKLSERDTHLFRVLFMLVSLELWRENVSTETIAGPIGKNANFGDVVWTMMGRNSKSFIREFSENGYPTFANFLVGYLDNIASIKFRGQRSVSQLSKKPFPHEYLKKLLE
jgi:hypothetical protein